ncbi:hypothetical protein CORC01_04917 [Colletotrichum orchidophilum]|uniref:Uncharacterized protein n=1 Tax=Colletotrichum orchidophilum TaxID=1209926 RepID=A0A1G4BEE6_9PEZI|nr:uncharacterized protein CORC01_04917 [Colletotrichum orchidophilum]OHE99781.1 hypothetical protein CORC01_04917 [Colletotrichum orchidophilum]
MYASTFITAFSALLAGASAATIPLRWAGVSNIAAIAERRQADASAATTPPTTTGNASWSAQNYIWGCSPGGCSARFNISAPAGYSPGAPGFNVVCSPIYIQQGWLPCLNPDNSPLGEDSQVFSIWTAGPDRERMYLGVEHLYKRQEDGLSWNATAGTNILPVQNMSFTFPVNTIVVLES